VLHRVIVSLDSVCESTRQDVMTSCQSVLFLKRELGGHVLRVAYLQRSVLLFPGSG